MAYDWERSARVAERLIRRYGRACVVRVPAAPQASGGGSGRPWDTRTPSGGASAPAAGAGTPSVAVRLRFATRDVDGVNVRMTDVLLLLDPKVAPEEGGSVEFDGSTYRILATQPVSPAGTVVLYRVQGRA